ncbi:hypothetical protein RND71_043604 [Anisodus tanguticus]|uniref:UBC core domain-containing protein n=1 Tax=Anisodus tanguticus TaxID=243964 RepID=A0AAE1QPR0_9SOLA|nr:hypothetical protein RND71_043604 [Anisodus tanguticus]
MMTNSKEAEVKKNENPVVKWLNEVRFSGEMESLSALQSKSVANSSDMFDAMEAFENRVTNFIDEIAIKDQTLTFLANGSSNVENLSPQVIRSVIKELRDIVKESLEGIKVIFNDEDVTDIQAIIDGPAGTPYQGGAFRIRCVLGKEFPSQPPKAYFITKVFHPNVSRSGEICVNTLKKDWKPDLALVAMDHESYADKTPLLPSVIPLVDLDENLLPVQFVVEPSENIEWGKDENNVEKIKQFSIQMMKFSMKFIKMA